MTQKVNRSIYGWGSWYFEPAIPKKKPNLPPFIRKTFLQTIEIRAALHKHNKKKP